MSNQLPKGWAETSLREISSKLVDGSHIPPPKTALGKPMLSARNVRDGEIIFDEFRFIDPNAFDVEDRRTNIRAGDVLLTIVGTIGRSAVVLEGTEPFTLQRSVAVLRPIGFSPKLLMYFFQAPQTQKELQHSSRGTAQKGVYLKSLAKLVVQLPPLNEGKQIVAEIEKQFTRLDAGVVALKRVKANLKRYRAAVLKAAVEGRLVPTEAALARRESRSYEPASELLKRILAERRARWEAGQLVKMTAAGKHPKNSNWKAKYVNVALPDASSLPPPPEGWIWSSIGQVFDVYVGATPSRAKPEFWNGGIPWVSSGEVSFCRIRETREKITALGLENSSTHLHPRGTVLLGMIGEGKTRGQAAIIDVPACNNQNSAAIRVSETGLPPEYLYRFLESQYEATRKLSSGGNQPALNKDRVQAIPFPLPPFEEQRQIVAELERRLSVIDELEMQVEANLKRAERLRQSILKRAFDGKLVPQDPNEEPASILLERIKTTRAGRV